VHGDLRWDNCLAVAAPHSRRRTRLLLIDWELAGRGEAGFDVGTVLGEYLRVWVISVTIVEPSDPARLLALARHPLESMEPAVQAFWNAYRAASPCSLSLRRTIELAAVHLLQTAVEYARGLPSVSAHVGTLVQLADNLLRWPDDAASGLLGLRA
jgi:inactivated superfamily I helicase